MGFDPNSIMRAGELNIMLLIVNIVISLIAGGVAVFIANRMKNWMNKNNTLNRNIS